VGERGFLRRDVGRGKVRGEDEVLRTSWRFGMKPDFCCTVIVFCLMPRLGLVSGWASGI